MKKLDPAMVRVISMELGSSAGSQRWIVQFASQNDPWIPIKEARFVHESLNCEYHEFTDQGNFGGDYYKAEFPELLEVLKRKL